MRLLTYRCSGQPPVMSVSRPVLWSAPTINGSFDCQATPVTPGADLPGTEYFTPAAGMEGLALRAQALGQGLGHVASLGSWLGRATSMASASDTTGAPPRPPRIGSARCCLTHVNRLAKVGSGRSGPLKPLQYLIFFFCSLLSVNDARFRTLGVCGAALD